MGRLYARQLASRKNRKRAVGAGKPGLLPTGRHKLAFILFYLKVHPTLDVLGVFSGINGAECSRWVRKLMPLLEELPGQKQMLPKRRIGSVEEFAAAFPQAVEVMKDGLERPARRSKKQRPGAPLCGQPNHSHLQR
jgi:hypothetical protein